MIQTFIRRVLILLLVIIAPNLKAQSLVNGRVISSEDGEGLPGATIVVVGSSVGTVTDLEGNYSIEAKGDDVLVFSFVGFASTREAIGGRSVVDVTLEPDASELSEVVVMGYSIKSRQEISASASTLGSDDLQNVTSSNVESMLQGKVAGVSVTTSTGAPGSAAEIRIRGVNSLTADRAPLVVVDGMIGGTYQPNDVESVTILKDAAATALYGSLASGGVMVVTTKVGTKKNSEIEFSATLGQKRITTGNFSVMNGADLYEVQKVMWGTNTVGFLNQRPSNLEDQNFNWVDEVYQPGMLQNYYVAARGGSENSTYAVSLDYYNEDGTLVNTGYERISFRTNLGFQIKDNINLKTNFSVVQSDSNQDFWDWRYDPFLNLPWDNPYADDGSVKYIDNTTSLEWYGRDKRNVLHTAQYNYNKNKSLAMTGNVFLTIDMTEWLSLESRTMVSLFDSGYETFYDPRTKDGKASNGTLTSSDNSSRDAISTLILRGSKNIGKHSVGAFVGVEGASYYAEYLNASARNIPIGLNVLDAAAEPVSVGGSNVTSTRMSFLSELNYSYAGKYFLTGVFRTDGSSKFSPNNRWGYFPGVSASWLISEEDFFGEGPITFMKARASYGEVGNDNVGSTYFPYLSYYDLSTNYNGSPAGTIPLLADRQITWETVVSRNVGVDMSLFDRINVTLDYYQNSTKDMLLRVQLPLSIGYEEQLRNAGEVKNQGVELAVNADILKSTSKFSWNSGFNISWNKSEIVSLGDDDELYFGTGAQQISEVGGSLRQWYLPKWLGVNPDDGSPLWEKVNRDADGNVISREATSVYSQAEYQAVGDVLPKFYGGWTNSFAYKGISLNVLLSYQFGNKVYHSARQLFDSDGAYPEYNLMNLQDGWSRWEKPGDEATHPLPVRGGNQQSNAVSSRYLEDGDYIRLRNVSLGYAFPRDMISAIGLQSLNLSLSADNLITWTKFSGLDPETRISASEYELPGFQDFKYPISKQYLIKLTAKF
ncbi:SusC/RagA family TonB-linked outer membrane protein [Reichenbachiella agarivorans]|uniref:SusC/RagA family TonB-linked outer membrane protein n=1 Tax=Reichenbachiella agarivorans TaxID=2979464 RepID=A0ABY6CP02_9BACT|nr:SusC/RagA family TonB-linked outer membrane protein [Reichenbachiella agarivorans]UXP32241.1 SusC/RagA family TonB-linked outer membrane protein [Reichenbachiella agarivorans]